MAVREVVEAVAVVAVGAVAAVAVVAEEALGLMCAKSGSSARAFSRVAASQAAGAPVGGECSAQRLRRGTLAPGNGRLPSRARPCTLRASAADFAQWIVRCDPQAFSPCSTEPPHGLGGPV